MADFMGYKKMPAGCRNFGGTPGMLLVCSDPGIITETKEGEYW